MTISTPRRSGTALVSFLAPPFALALALTLALGCGSKEPEQAISFNDGILNMAISEQWVLQRDSGKKAYWLHGAASDAKLSFEDQTRDYGTPMSVQGVRSAIGSELNLRYGGVNARLGYGGTAVLSYKRTTKEGSKKMFTQNWVVAHPYGYGAVARVAITLKVPDGQQGTPEFQAIVDSLDKQVGDAKMPEA
jgi:hypothetical protein